MQGQEPLAGFHADIPCWGRPPEKLKFGLFFSFGQEIPRRPISCWGRCQDKARSAPHPLQRSQMGETKALQTKRRVPPLLLSRRAAPVHQKDVHELLVSSNT